MQESPFSHPLIAGLIATIVGGIVVALVVQWVSGSGPSKPSPISLETLWRDDPGAAAEREAARARLEAARSSAETDKARAAQEERRRRDEAAQAEFQRQQDALLARAQLQALQRKIQEEAAQRAIAYRKANGGCDLGTHRVCWTANASGTGEVLSNLGCHCEAN
jgi:hypothetical protein